MRRIIRVLLIIGAIAAAAGCIYTALYHEPNEDTLEFTSDPETHTVESDSLSYFMTFTGDNADTVEWDFGDGTSAEAFAVYKTYDGPGSYHVLCKAVNDNGTRYSAYSLTITESEHGLLDGYELPIVLLVMSVAMMIGAVIAGRE